MAATADRPVRFGVFEADLRSGELRRRGLIVRLQPLPSRVLAALLESAGEVVTRDDLQRKLWPGDTYVEFDLGLNAAIKKLRQALGDNPRNPHFIETLPRRGYRFIFPVESLSPEPPGVSPIGLSEGKNGQPAVEAPAPGGAPTASRVRSGINYRRVALLVAGLLIAFSLVIRFLGTFDPGRDASVEAGPLRFEARPLFELRGGLPRSPALSPDGKSVAFTWEGEGQPQGGNAHIYVTAIDGGRPRRVTTGTDPEDHASWSPEGQRIAFVRTPGGKARGTYVVSLIDGSLVKVGRYPSGTPPAWTPDGKWLICANGHIWKGSLETREQEEWLPESEVSYHSPAVSPDGKILAFAGCRRGGSSCDVYVRPMEGGEPQRLTFANLAIAGLTWTPDSREIVFSMDGRMYRLPAVAGMQPGRIEFLSRDRVSRNVRHLSLAPLASGGFSRLVFMDGKLDVDIWVTDLSQEPGSQPSGRKLIDSPTIDLYPEYSPDGSKIGFYSVQADRSRELWVCDQDGANARPLTPSSFRAADAAGPAWSPDSRSIAFRASTPEDPAYHIYTIGLDGGVPQRITDGEDEFKPRWARDGRHIYYCSNSKEGWGIWRASPGGFSGLRVDTSQPSLGTCLSSYDESPDGRFVYSFGTDGEGYGALWRAPVHGTLSGQQWGKKEKVLAPFIQDTALHFRGKGLYFLSDAGRRLVWEDVRQLPLRLWSPETGKITEVAKVEASIPLHFSMSPDGRSVLTNHIETRSAVLMLVDDFR